MRVSMHIYGVSQEIDGKMFIGLLFLFIEMKELCEARAKLEMSSNLADKPTLANVPPIWNCLMKKVTATHFHTVNENPFEMVNL